MTLNETRPNKALVPTAGAALPSVLFATRTRHPVSMLTSVPAIGALGVRPNTPVSQL